MKVIFVSVFLMGSILLLNADAYSQSGPRTNHKGPKKGEFQHDYAKLKADLGLTDAQVDSLKSFDATFKKKMEAIRKDINLKEEDKKAKMKGLRDEKKANMKKVLTEEQYKKFISQRSENKLKPDYEKLKTDLGLTNTQVDSLKAFDIRFKKKMDGLRKDSGLKEEDKKVKMKELHEEKKSNMKKVLTEEQYKKYLSDRPDRRKE
jgi:hypothetical protein